jgi:hypothetical protein
MVQLQLSVQSYEQTINNSLFLLEQARIKRQRRSLCVRMKQDEVRSSTEP